MKLVVSKSLLSGKVVMPASKSHTIRALAIASLANGQSLIQKPLVSRDTLSAVNCYRELGAEIDILDSNLWKVSGTNGHINAIGQTIDVGNSGTTLRFAMGSAALAEQGQVITFTGDEQIQTRPVGSLMKSLMDLGASCKSIKDNGKIPVQISGKLKGGKTSISATTSQYLSSLLLCTPLAANDTEIEVALLNEPDYVQMTLDWLNRQKIQYENHDFHKFSIRGKQVFKAFEASIPADFSSATFFLCAGAMAADKVQLQGLDFSDSQPDKAVVDYLKQMGANIKIEGKTVTIRGGELRGVRIDMNRTPDALCAMAVTAAFARGTTELINVPQARSKETDRIRCMAKELRKMNIDIDELPDGLKIHRSKPKAARLHGWADHRIVMALAMAGLNLEEEFTVDTAEAIDVTFPDYVKLMQALGANMELKQ
ncbi:MAG: 3-phosphoshikimate 1-carboxyvinyltransferase [Sedimentisphaerales bacterium]|nr:3-phosphoshikimate 1-carboxyvinyltransferase [Sedimentisphaerales bacterium]